jgi:hypothetical protein
MTQALNHGMGLFAQSLARSVHQMGKVSTKLWR